MEKTKLMKKNSFVTYNQLNGHEGLACMISDRYTVADTHLKMTKTGAGILCVNDGMLVNVVQVK
eukprot:Awhi_evm1s1233